MKNDTNINVRIPVDLYNAIKDIADNNYLTISAVVKIVLVEYLKRYADK